VAWPCNSMIRMEIIIPAQHFRQAIWKVCMRRITGAPGVHLDPTSSLNLLCSYLSDLLLSFPTWHTDDKSQQSRRCRRRAKKKKKRVVLALVTSHLQGRVRAPITATAHDRDKQRSEAGLPVLCSHFIHSHPSQGLEPTCVPSSMHLR
jgi:hypothetical protein